MVVGTVIHSRTRNVSPGSRFGWAESFLFDSGATSSTLTILYGKRAKAQSCGVSL
ncbi:hypothetical protein BDZ89DRAFT_1085208 [Hymenopellis radicata]|nr:hypothetical protein BDZ89DRAFT_1085208 [Hymenopellis radicata]